MPYAVGDRLQLVREQTFGSYTFPGGTLGIVRDAFGSPGGRVRSYIVELRTVVGDAAMTIELAEAVIDEVFLVYIPDPQHFRPIEVYDQAQVGSTAARISAVDVFLGPTEDFPLPGNLGVFPASLDDLVAVEVRPPPEPVPVRQAPGVPVPFSFATSTSMAAPLVADRASSVRTLSTNLLSEHVVEVDRGEFVALGQVVRKGLYVLGELLVRTTGLGVQEWVIVRGSFGQETGPPTTYTLKLVRDSSGPVGERPLFVVTLEQLNQQGWRRLPFERGTRLRRRLDGYPAEVDGIYDDGRVVLLCYHAVTGDPLSITVWFDDLDDSWERVLDGEAPGSDPGARKTAWEWLELDGV